MIHVSQAPNSLAVEQDGVVLRLWLDNVANRNALSAELLSALDAALRAAETDTTIRVVVLGHRGPVFSSGADLKARAGVPAPPIPSLSLDDVLEAISSMATPVIGVAHGKVRAGGIGLLASCDIAIAASTSDFAFTEVRLGVVPAVIDAPVAAVMRPRDRWELFLTGEVFSAERAADTGLITRVVVPEAVDAEVERLVDAIRRGAPGAIGVTKAILRGREQAVRRRLSTLTFAAPEAQAGLAARVSKTDPPWLAETDPSSTQEQ